MTQARSGFLYISVLFTTLIVVATATAAFSISTSRWRGESIKADGRIALRSAEAEGHRLASLLSTADLTWRTNWTHGTVSAARNADDGATVSTVLTDTDGSLSDDQADVVNVTCYANVGQAKRGITYQLKPVIKPLPILNYCLVSSVGIVVAPSGDLACTGQVLSGATIAVDPLAVASAEAWHATIAIAAIARGQQLVTAQSVSIPSSSIATTYAASATAIPLTSLPLVSGSRRLQEQILTSTNNPFGTANTAGIYSINAGGGSLTVMDCRIEATLVVTNCSLLTITSANVWNSPTPGGVALITTAPVRIDNATRYLKESTVSYNYNPTGLPFRGVANTSSSDRYQCELRGLLYTSSSFEWTDTNQVNGMLVKGTIVCAGAVIGGTLSIEADNRLVQSPPIGFRYYDSMQFVRGSWRSVLVP